VTNPESTGSHPSTTFCSKKTESRPTCSWLKKFKVSIATCISRSTHLLWAISLRATKLWSADWEATITTVPSSYLIKVSTPRILSQASTCQQGSGSEGS
jgi:hypothetical protein